MLLDMILSVKLIIYFVFIIKQIFKRNKKSKWKEIKVYLQKLWL